MATANKTAPREIVSDVDAGAKKFVSRDEWLSLAGVLKEEEHHVEGLGWLLLSEITGDVRAEIVGQQSIGLLADQKKVDAKAYQRQLIMSGVVDPDSPPGNRTPMFRAGDLDRVMRVGGAKIAEVVDHIEKLSALGQYGGEPEKNSDNTRNGATTS